MDSYEGSQSDPLSLHKYLYGHANPVNRIDPSGYEGELTTQQAVAMVTGILGAAVVSSTYQALSRVNWNVSKARYHHEVATEIAVADEAAYEKPKSKAQVRERVKEKTKNDSGSLIFLHGSSRADGDLLSGIVDFTRGKGSLGAGFYTADFPSGLIEAGASAFDKSGGDALIFIFAMKVSDFNTLKGIPVIPYSLPIDAFSPGCDYTWSPLGTTIQRNWQPGSKGAALLFTGFRGFVPLPNYSDWIKPE